MSSDTPQAIIDSSDDEDLRIALALSLQDHETSAKTPPTRIREKQPILQNQVLVELDSDEDDDDLDRPSHFSKPAIVADNEFEHTPRRASGYSIFTKSYGNMAGGVSPKKFPAVDGKFKSALASKEPDDQPYTVSTPSKRGLLSMDRVAMEAERLARANKRKAPISPPPLQRDPKRSNWGNSTLGKKNKEESDSRRSRALDCPKSPPDFEVVEPAPRPNGAEGRKAAGKSCPRGYSQPELEIVAPKHHFKNVKPSAFPHLHSHSHTTEPGFEVLSGNPAAKKHPEAARSDRPSASHSRPQPEPSPELVILPSKSKADNTPKLSGLTYPNGIVLKTWAFSHERSDDIKIEEVLQKTTLKLAVISSFQWDMEWLHTKIHTHSTKLILVMQAEGEAQRTQYREETKDASYLRLCFPPMGPMVHRMHSKLMLLSHPDYLRVCVPTANVTAYDWGETRPAAVMENSAFIIDFPRLPDGERVQLEDMTEFGKELVYFAEAMELQKGVVQSLHAFDFSASKGYAFIHSIGGTHTGQTWRRTGYCGLGRAVKELGLATELELDVDYIASSIGAVNRHFLATLYLAAQGDDGMREYASRYGAKSSGTGSKLRGEHAPASLPSDFMDSLDERFRLFFPSEETVTSSKGGKDNAGVICFQEKWWESPKFPRKALRDCKSRRKGLLMHNKIMYVQPSLRAKRRSISMTGKAWAYVGSANLSESAWGKLVLDRSSKTPKLSCRNWECGVIVPVQPLGESESLQPSPSSSTRDLKAFESRIPVPMEYPGEVLGVRRPWFMSYEE